MKEKSDPNSGARSRVENHQGSAPKKRRRRSSSGSQSGGSNRSKGGQPGKVEPLSLRSKMGCLGFVILVLLALAFVLWKMRAKGEGKPAPKKQDQALKVEIPVYRPQDGLGVRVVAEKFLAATTAEQRLQWVVNPEAVRSRMSSYAEQALSAPASSWVRVGSRKAEGLAANQFLVSFADGGRRLMCLEQTAAGYRVDWDAYARYCTASWSDILAGQVDSAEVRVFARPVSYYNFAYRDESRWQSFVLSSPDIEEVLYAYVEKGSKAQRLLSQELKRSTRSGVPVTLKISKIKEGAKRKQFIIERALAIGWVIEDPEFESRWVDPYTSQTGRK